MSKLNKKELSEIRQLLLKELKMFDPKLKSLSLEELEQYYLNLRKEEFEKGIPLQYLETRKKIQPILLTLVKIDRILSFESLKVISDKSTPTDRPVLFAWTHIGGNDIQRFFEANKVHTYLFLGDPKELYRDFSGLLLNLNGNISFETNNKNDKKIATARSVELLNQNGKEIICPEGAWNITHNLPCLKLYKGTVRMARETNAIIIPGAIAQYGRKFYVNIGENIDVNLTPNIGIDELNEQLRDTLATLKWEIWERQKPLKRAKISQQYIDGFKQSLVDKCPYGFTIQDVEEDMYKDPNIVEPSEGYEFLEKRKQLLKTTENTIVFDESHDQKCRENAKALFKELRKKRDAKK